MKKILIILLTTIGIAATAQPPKKVINVVGGGSSGGGASKYTTNGYGILTDSTGSLYTISADTSSTAKLRDAKLNSLTDALAGYVTPSSTNTLTNKTISGSSNTITNIANSSLTNSSLTIAGNSTALGGSVTQDQITGLSSTGLLKRTGTNTLSIAIAGTDYAPAVLSGSTSTMNAISSPTPGQQFWNTDYNAMMMYSPEWGWQSNDDYWRIKNLITVRSDMGFGTTTGEDIQSSVSSSGTVTATSTGADGTHQGLSQISTATNASGQASYSFANNTNFGQGRILLDTWIRTPTVASNLTDQYVLIIGFTDLVPNSTDGIYFLYDTDSASSGSTKTSNWQTVTSNNTSRTFTTTSTAFATSTWFNFQIIVNAAGSSVEFKINGATVATHTTDIPSGSSRVATGFVLVKKIAGTTAVNAQIDQIFFKQKLTTPL